MSNVRFLDNVLVTARETGGSNSTAGTYFPRVVFADDVKTVPTNVNVYTYEVFNLGVINITPGTSIEIGGETVFSHGLLRIEETFTNSGTINVNGILELGEVNTFADVNVI
jgi:hypothetical protein